jgi:hypothetical protein
MAVTPETVEQRIARRSREILAAHGMAAFTVTKKDAAAQAAASAVVAAAAGCAVSRVAVTSAAYGWTAACEYAVPGDDLVQARILIAAHAVRKFPPGSQIDERIRARHLAEAVAAARGIFAFDAFLTVEVLGPAQRIVTANAELTTQLAALLYHDNVVQGARLRSMLQQVEKEETTKAEPSDEVNDEPSLPFGLDAHRDLIVRSTRKLIGEHGLASAFTVSRNAAIAHAAATAVVTTAEGFTVKRLRIRQVGESWTGSCTEAAIWSVRSDAPEPLLQRARIIAAGHVIAHAYKLAQPGMALDEAVVSMHLADHAAALLGVDAKDRDQFWRERVWRAVIDILNVNNETFNALGDLLDRHGEVRGERLMNVLMKVTTELFT